ncbi:MAG: threonylcarbamoyl-AMP synthase [Actinobacteria bacterium]|nr:threonylcarbamoyl-AMP synthase [Actinomycetota bacterium]MSZ13509.1 threonylcarbamoyl-AMP synthase [Actinomycetota bacterium]MSZ28614.1 threonylcarbamoyl-AMP synthase [Actinomycetota bacterium]
MVLAAQKLMNGHLVAFPTETVYGLGADATNESAVAKIYAAKGRPADHPLIVHVHSMQAMGDWAQEIPTYAIDLARDFWPGPMTLILNRSLLARDFITGGQNTVGIRVPDHVVALALLNAFHAIGGKGIAAPSANRFGHVSPTTAQAVKDELGSFLNEQDQILDGGPCTVGVESTIIDCTGDVPKILRPGAITAEMITASTGLDVVEPTDSNDAGKESIRVSGSLDAHYAPAAKVLLDQNPHAGQGFIAPATTTTPDGVIRLASPTNDVEFAQTLYASLRKADELGLSHVVIEQPTGTGIAIAIRDRLMRAANGR